MMSMVAKSVRVLSASVFFHINRDSNHVQHLECACKDCSLPTDINLADIRTLLVPHLTLLGCDSVQAAALLCCAEIERWDDIKSFDCA